MTDSTIDWYEIKGRYMAGEKPKRLAQMYEIDPKQLSNIIVRQGWRKQREEIRLKVAEEFVDAQRELNRKAMHVVDLVLSSLITEDGTLNWEACKTIKSSVLRLCLQMAMPDKVKVREVTHTFGEGPEPWRTFTEPPSTDDTPPVSKTEQKFEFENPSAPEFWATSHESSTFKEPLSEDALSDPTAGMADPATPLVSHDVSKSEQKFEHQNNSSPASSEPEATPPAPTVPEPPQPSKLLMLAQLPHMWDMWNRINTLMAQAPRLSLPDEPHEKNEQNRANNHTSHDGPPLCANLGEPYDTYPYPGQPERNRIQSNAFRPQRPV
jgi:hypothetical protein